MEINDTDIKPELPIHVILGADKYAKFSTKDKDPGEPIEEFRAVGWTIMSPGNETNLSSVYLTRSSCAAFMY